MAPESPQVVTGAFLVGWRRDRNHLIVTRIEAAGHASNRAALAGGIPPLEHDDGRDAALPGPSLERVEACLLLRQLLFEVVVAQLLAEIEVVEHVELPLDALERIRTVALAPGVRPVPSTRRRAALSPIETSTDRVAKLRGDDDGAIALVLALDDVPGCRVRAGAANRAIGGTHELVEHAPSASIASFVTRHRCKRILLERLQPLPLRRLLKCIQNFTMTAPSSVSARSKAAT